MALGIQNNIMNNLPTVGSGTLVGSISIAGGASVNLLSIPELIRSALNSAYAALVPPEDAVSNVGTRNITLMADATGLVLGHKSVGGATVLGFPLPHIPTGGGAHPAPLSLPLGDMSGQAGNSELMVFNTTGGAVVLYAICWAEK
jgi:hypothetical protein